MPETGRMFGEHIRATSTSNLASHPLAWQGAGEEWHGVLTHLPLVDERITTVPWAVVALDRGIKGAGSTEPEAIAKYFSTTPIEIAQGKTVWPEERGGAVGNSEIGLMKANSDFKNGTGLAVPVE